MDDSTCEEGIKISMSKTLIRVMLTAMCGVFTKYNEELAVIKLIIAKSSKENLNSSLIDFFRT